MKRWKRRLFKSLWFLLAVLVLAAAGTVYYVHRVGLPQWAQWRVLHELERYGIVLHCDQLRLDLQRGIVANDVVLELRGRKVTMAQAKKIVLGVKLRNWLWGKSVVDSFQLTEARIMATLPQTAETFRVEHAMARVRLGSDGVIDLDQLSAEVMGIKLSAHGYLIPIRPKMTMDETSTAASPLQIREDVIAQVVKAIRETRFQSRPQVHLEFSVDLDDPKNGSIGLDLRCGPAQYHQWGVDSVRVKTHFEKQDLDVELFQSKLYGGEVLLRGHYDLSSGAFDGHLKSSTDLLQFISLLPTTWQGFVKSAQFETNPQIDLTVKTEALTPRKPIVEGSVILKEFSYRGVTAKRIEAHVDLKEQMLRATRVRLVREEGEAAGEYEENLDTRDFVAKVESTLDVMPVQSFLSEKDRLFFKKFVFRKGPPHLLGEVRGNWGRLQDVRVSGHVEAEDFVLQKLPIQALSADLVLEHEQAAFTHVVMTEPDGEARGSYHAGLHDNQFVFVVESSTIDPHTLRPVLTEATNAVLDCFQFERPPSINGTIRGDWHDIHKLKVDGTVVSGPVKIRGVPFQSSETKWTHEDDRSRFAETRLTRPEGEVRGEATYDYPTRVAIVKLTCTANPHEVAGVISARAITVLEPYQFDTPPTVELAGVVDFLNPARHDLTAKITGKRFHYWKFVTDDVSTDLIYHDQVLSLQNFDASLYGGTFQADMNFELSKNPVPFQADAKLHKSDLNQIASALSGQPSKLQGLLTAKMKFTATTAGFQTVEGKGNARVSEGLIWTLPVFGSGYSKSQSAEASFAVSQDFLTTDDANVDAGATRVTAHGRYQLTANELDFNAQAHIWGATPISPLGWIFNPFTKLLEFHLGGKLGNPQLRPLYLPKELFNVK